MFEQYLDTSAPVDEAIRHDWCPFHKASTTGFVVTRTKNGWLMYCHNCGGKRFIPYKRLTPTQTLARIRQRGEAPERKVKRVSLPRDFSLDIPSAGLVWLAKYKVTDSERLRYRFGYSEVRDRLIMPVFKDGELVYWQGRNLGEATAKKPKYHNVRSDRKATWFKTYHDYPDKPVVLVEDILSALAIARAGYNGVSLLGCHVPDELMADLQDKPYPRVIVWLDPDKRKESLSAARRCAVYGLRATSILTATRDPKEYEIQDIQKFIDGDADDRGDGDTSAHDAEGKLPEVQEVS